MKKITTTEWKKLGKFITSATGLRRMANYLQKYSKTKGDVLVNHYIHKWKVDGKIKYTLGIEIDKTNRRKEK